MGTRKNSLLSVDNMKTRICKTCCNEMALVNFRKNKKNSDGLDLRCNACRKVEERNETSQLKTWAARTFDRLGLNCSDY